MLRRWSLVGLGLALFLVAAKAHGRQVRLERELAGYWSVIFGGQNPPFVEALWRRERWVFWSLAAAFALLTVGYRLVARIKPAGGVPGALALHVVVPFILGFVAAGLLSLLRFASEVRAGEVAPGPRPEDWLSHAAWGSAAWWLLTFVLGAAVVLLVRGAARRPARE